MKGAKNTLLALVFTAPVLAQTNGTYLIQVSGTVSPLSPTVSVEIWAAWDQPAAGAYYWYGGNLDLVASEGEWSNPVMLLAPGPGSNAGTPMNSTITGIAVTQFVCGSFGCIPPNTSNPYPLIRAEWTTTDFTPRSVQLFSEGTMHFVLAESTLHRTFQLYPSNFTPGSGVINVVPAPAAWPLAGLLLVSPWRRRR